MTRSRSIKIFRTMQDKRDKRDVLLRNMLAGGTCAGLVTCVGNPLDALRVRWQVHTPGKDETIWRFGKHIVQKEGLVRGLWRPGIAANAIAIGLSSSIGYGFYPVVRDEVSQPECASILCDLFCVCCRLIVICNARVVKRSMLGRC